MGKGIQKITFSFSETAITHLGGMFLFHLFCKKLKLKKLFQQEIRITKHGNSPYHISDLLIAIIYIMVAGIQRIKNSRTLQSNGSIQKLLGLTRFPSPSKLTRFLLKYAPDIISGIKKVHNNLQLRIFFYLYQRTSFILDIDSTVLPLYGRKIQGAEIGYNPTKRGRPSYHPLLVFEGHTQESWGGIQRPGNVASSTDSIPFVKVCLTKIPKNIYRIRLRADEGFYSWNMVNFLDGEKVGFVIVAKITAPIKCMLPGLKYHTFRKGWECAEFKYQPDKWEKHYRFVAVRKLINQEEPAVTLFTIEDYAYHIYVTNLFLQPQEVFHFYNGRCHAELDIKELKINLPLAKIPTRNFVANEAYLQIILLAYNLVVWFKIFCLPKKFQKKKLMNLRLDLLMLPARLVKSGSHNILKLPVGYIYQREFFHILQNIQKLKIPK